MLKDPVQEERVKSSNRVRRGGSWFRDPASLVVSYRRYEVPRARGSDLGIRPVRNAKEKK